MQRRRKKLEPEFKYIAASPMRLLGLSDDLLNEMLFEVESGSIHPYYCSAIRFQHNERIEKRKEQKQRLQRDYQYAIDRRDKNIDSFTPEIFGGILVLCALFGAILMINEGLIYSYLDAVSYTIAVFLLLLLVGGSALIGFRIYQRFSKTYWNIPQNPLLEPHWNWQHRLLPHIELAMRTMIPDLTLEENLKIIPPYL